MICCAVANKGSRLKTVDGCDEDLKRIQRVSVTEWKLGKG